MKRLGGSLVAVAILAWAGLAQAQNYPARYVTVIVPFSAGSPGDVFIRIVAAGLSKELGQQVVVENIGGAGGTTGVTRGAKAEPDGYTMVMASAGTHGGALALYPNLAYHPADSFDGIALIGTTPIAIVSRSAIPAKTLSEFSAYLKANEKTVTEATAGVGSTSHITCAFYRSLIGVRPTAVPFRGTSDATQAILAGNVDYICNQLPVTVEHVKAGALRAYAMTGEKRSPQLPDVPTTAEAGLPAFDASAWVGLQFPKGTPASIIKRANEALNKALEHADVRQRLIEQGVDIAPLERRTPEWLDGFIRREVARWTPLLQAELAAQQKK
jgi:tripartite-type tricarboxylate transporter receptor subunit TctC